MNWGERIREIAERVAGMELGSEEEYAVAFLKEVQREITVEAYPDEVKVVQSVAGGLPRMVAYKYLDGEYKDAWGKSVRVDSVVVAVAKVEGYSDGLAEFSFPVSEEEAMSRKYGFIGIGPEEHEEVLRELERYIYTDTMDVKNTPGIFAIRPMGMKADTPVERWNAIAKRFERERVEQYIEEILNGTRREVERIMERLGRDGVDRFYIRAGFLGGRNGSRYEIFAISKDEYIERKNRGEDISPVYVRVWMEHRGVSREVIMEDLDFTRLMEDYLHASEEIDEYLDEKKRLWDVLTQDVDREEIPETLVEVRCVSGCRGWEAISIVYDAKRGLLHVPKNLVGLIIGKKGRTIKRIERVVGRRVRIVEEGEMPIEGRLSVHVVGEKRFVELEGWARDFVMRLYEIRKDNGLVVDEWKLIEREIEEFHRERAPRREMEIGF